MLTAKEVFSISQLAGPMLTLYLNTASAEASHHPPVSACLTWLKKEGKKVARSLPPSERAPFQKELGRVEKFLYERRPEERSLVIFAGPGMWREIPLQVGIENELHWGKPAVLQLLWLTEEHKPYCLIVVDHAGARFFRYQLRETIELENKKYAIDISQWKRKELGHVTGQMVRKTRGSQRDVFEHRMKAQYARLCGETAKIAAELCKKENFAGIFLVGSHHLTGPIKEAIPQELSQRVILFKEDFGGLSSSELQERLEPTIENWEHQQEAALVAELLHSEHGTVVGVDESLAQLQKGRVRTLVLTRDLNLSLRQCVKCGWIDRSADPLCPTCAEKRRPVMLLEILPDLAKRYDINLEIVSGEAAESLKKGSGMGAWLREAKLVATR
jgi:hypothetical protein